MARVKTIDERAWAALYAFKNTQGDSLYGWPKELAMKKIIEEAIRKALEAERRNPRVLK